MSDDFKDYTKNVIYNAKALSERLTEKGFKIFSGGTDTHLMLLDLRSFGVTGKDAQASLGKANITCNDAIKVDYRNQHMEIVSLISVDKNQMRKGNYIANVYIDDRKVGVSSIFLK